jgi:hypothetical protein
MVCLNDFVYDYKAFNATVVLRHTLLFYKLFTDNITLTILKVWWQDATFFVYFLFL